MMKAVILAGGLGSRLSEETHAIPKPMVEIGGKPILWHIMKIYSQHGINDFVICCGYKGYLIKEYFNNFLLHASDVTIDLTSGKREVLTSDSEPWRVTLIDTGIDTMTGGRLKRIKEHVEDNTFCMTYCDAVADIDIKKQIEFHKAHKKLATVTAVTPPGRWGVLKVEGEKVTGFSEKMTTSSSRINAGFFVLEPSALDTINGDATIWEREPLETLSGKGQLMAYAHDGYWQAMDTIRERQILESQWATGEARWKTWK